SPMTQSAKAGWGRVGGRSRRQGIGARVVPGDRRNDASDTGVELGTMVLGCRIYDSTRASMRECRSSSEARGNLGMISSSVLTRGGARVSEPAVFHLARGQF